LNPLGGEGFTTVPYKPDPQARYLIVKMMESEKSVVDASSTLLEQMLSLKNVDSYGEDLQKVQAKVNLAMQSISLVQQEQVNVPKSFKLHMGSTPTTRTNSRVMGPSLGMPTTSSVGLHQPPSPPPSGNLLRHHQLMPTLAHISRTSSR
jgi:hypothetical protein